jgi:hypothetical protein
VEVLTLRVNCSQRLEGRRGMRPRVLLRALVASPSCALDMMAECLSDAHSTVDYCRTYGRFRAASRHGMWRNGRNGRRGCGFCPKPAHGEVL